MQQSSMVVFCDECGLANEPDASHCAACQHPLGGARSVPYTPPPIAPVTIARVPMLEVMPGPLFMPNISSAPGTAPVPGVRLPARQHPGRTL